MNPEWKSRYDLAVDVTVKAGDLARTIFDSTFDVEWKEDRSPVTVADRNAEQLIREIVGKHLETHRFVADLGKNIFHESTVVRNSCLAHERWVGGQAFDVRLGAHVKHARLIRAIGENLHGKLAK